MDQHRCCYLVVYKRVDTRASLYLLDYSLHVFICWASCNSQGQKSRLCHTKSGIDLLAFRNIKYPFIFSPVIILVMVPWSLRPHQALESQLLSYEAAASSGLLHFIRALGVLFFLLCFSHFHSQQLHAVVIHDQYLHLQTATIPTSLLTSSANQMPFTLSCSLHVRETFPATRPEYVCENFK